MSAISEDEEEQSSHTKQGAQDAGRGLIWLTNAAGIPKREKIQGGDKRVYFIRSNLHSDPPPAFLLPPLAAD